jgi:4-amino-4-deoxy-L-arabinose transferase-like glycosyltransferase
MKVSGSVQAVLLLAAIAGLLLVLRLCPVVSRPGVVWAMRNDSIGYIRLAEGLTGGCGFAPRFDESCGPAELERTPGYPLFLAAMPSLRSALIVQDVLGAGICFLIALFAWHRWGLLAGLLAESLLGFDIPSIVNGNLVLSDTLFTSLITSAILLQLISICKAKLEGRGVAFLLGAGLLLGIAALVRPVGQVLIVEAPIPFVLFPHASLRKRVVLMFLALCLPSIIVLGWSYRNYERRGIWTFSSIGAVNLYAYRGAGVLAYETGRGFGEVQAELIRSVPRIEAFKSSDVFTKTFTGDPQYVDQSDDTWSNTFDADPPEMERLAARILLDHPVVAAVTTLKGFLRNCFWVQRLALSGFLLGGRFDLGQQQVGFSISHKLLSTLSYGWLSLLILVEFLVLVFSWIGVSLAIWSTSRARLRRSGLISILLFVPLLLLCATAGPEASDRFRVPAMPALAIVAASGWAATLRRRNRLEGRRAMHGGMSNRCEVLPT